VSGAADAAAVSALESSCATPRLFHLAEDLLASVRLVFFYVFTLQSKW